VLDVATAQDEMVAARSIEIQFASRRQEAIQHPFDERAARLGHVDVNESVGDYHDRVLFRVKRSTSSMTLLIARVARQADCSVTKSHAVC
jgi:hypothetical protein